MIRWYYFSLRKSDMIYININIKVIICNILLLVFTSCSTYTWLNSDSQNRETYDCIKIIKYRSYGSVNVCNEKFIKLENIWDKSVFWAWYDKDNQYMIIQLKKTNYHYCGLSASDWSWIENTNDADKYYISHIKWRYDCRNAVVPNY